MTWKFQLLEEIVFISSTYDEEQLMGSYSKNIEIMINDKADNVIRKPFRSLLNKYQINLEKSIKDSNFIFHCVDLLRYRCHVLDHI